MSDKKHQPTKFELEVPYTVDETVRILRGLLEAYSGEPELKAILEENLNWARRHDQNITTITWQEREDGSVTPVASSGFYAGVERSF